MAAIRLASLTLMSPDAIMDAIMDSYSEQLQIAEILHWYNDELPRSVSFADSYGQQEDTSSS